QPTSLKDPKLEKLKQVLIDWINRTLNPEHIVVQSLEEDLYDGLVFHHLLSRLASVNLPVEEISLTSVAQIRKLEVILAELDQRLGLRDSSQTKWNIKLIHNKDLLATIHLLVAMVKCFQPEMDLPPNVKVEVVAVEVSSRGIKSDVQTEVLTEDTLYFKLPYLLIFFHFQAILHFVNQNMSTMGLQVADMDKQFADGVILLLLIGQLEGFFVPLCDFNLTPVNHSEMHPLILAASVALWMLMVHCKYALNVYFGDYVTDIVSEDVTATLKVLYALFKKHKGI
uniref:Parvin, gamma n=1 Tax=Seriola lalandi dorsalis TaxID=1841481 RepID=A0A3B4YQU7_SERLL